jgi:hypothetical protein
VASTTGTGGGHARGKGQRGRQRRPPIARSPEVERPSGPGHPTAALRGAERATGWGRGDRTFMIAHPQWRCSFVWRFGSDEARDMFGGELRELSIVIFGDLFLVSVLHL